MKAISTLQSKMLLVAALIFGLQGSLMAQGIKVSGTVRDAENDEALPFVNVALTRVADTVFMRGATTDANGHFSITNADTGHYLLMATSVGYNSYSAPLHLTSDISDISIKMRSGTTLAEVSIVSDKPLYVMDGEKNLYNTHDDPSIQTGTASDALQNAPGVEVDAEGNITLRGVSSVEIWINDRPSHMNAEALKQYIKTLPANAIERIEVITNPSARYSTSGGIINIVTNQTVRRNELLCLGIHANTMPNISPWISYVYANEKFDINVYLNGSATRHRSTTDNTTTLLDANGDTSRFTTTDCLDNGNSYGGYSGINLSWNIDSSTYLASWMGFYPVWNSGESTTDYSQINYPSLYEAGYQEQLKESNSYSGGYIGAWFQHSFDTTGRKLSATLSGNLWNNKSNYAYMREFKDTLQPTQDIKRYSYSNSPSGSLSVDYHHPLAHGFELDAGIHGGIHDNHDKETRDTLATSGVYVQELLRSTQLYDRSYNLDGYATLLKRWGTLTAKIGLRAEQNWEYGRWSFVDGSSLDQKDTSFFGLVPSIHLSYSTKDFQSYSISYTRRFSDPSISSLSLFRYYDDHSYSTGNPALLRSYTHNLEAAWSKYFMGFGNISINAYYRLNTNEQGTMALAGFAPEYFGSQMVNYTMPVNIGSSHTEGIEANIAYRPTGMMNIRLNASVFNYGYDYNGDVNNHLAYSARLNVWAKLWGWLEVFANAHYTSPHLSLYQLSVANKGFDFGLSSEFFDRRLSIYVNVNDIFGMAEWGSNTTAPQYQTTGSTHYDSRFVSLGLTWRIGKMELESKARQGGSDGTNQM